MSLVLHESLHLVGDSQRSRRAAPQAKHGIDMGAHIGVSLTNQVPPSIALRHFRKWGGGERRKRRGVEREGKKQPDILFVNILYHVIHSTL